jgi:twitching motility protein PilT
MEIKEVFKKMMENNASDLHLSADLPPTVRINGDLKKVSDKKLSNEDVADFINRVLGREGVIDFDKKEDFDCAVDIGDIVRLRVNVYYDHKGICAAFRLIPPTVKSFEELGLPLSLRKGCDLRRGLVLVTGVTGSGKSTTLAAMLDRVNAREHRHIITLEDPIEYLHPHKKSIVNQREIGVHVPSFAAGVRSALREDPDVILVGEMRDLDTIAMAITAAETGHLVFATLHTKSAAESIDRIIDAFPPAQQAQVRTQLSNSLAMIVSQILIPSADKERRYPACEMLFATAGVRNLIREGKIHQIPAAIETGHKYGMQTLKGALELLASQGKIDREDVDSWVPKDI